jgi:hypothetical protein
MGKTNKMGKIIFYKEKSNSVFLPQQDNKKSYPSIFPVLLRCFLNRFKLRCKRDFRYKIPARKPKKRAEFGRAKHI